MRSILEYFNRLNKSQQITTIAFDLGGVLITEINYPLSKEEDIIERKVFSINNQEKAYKEAMRLTGLDIVDVKKAFKNICQNIYTLREPKIFKNIPKLKFAIASNAPKEMHEWINKTKLPKLDFVLISCDIGIGKPNRAFYEILVKGLKEKPENILFIDDIRENVLAAKKFGLQAIQYNRDKLLSVIINEYLDKQSVTLTKFNNAYFKSLPKSDRKKMILDLKNPFFTINQKGQDVGICGVLNNMFFQIIVDPKFRGQNIVEKSSNEIMKELNLKQIFATIDIDNIASYKAHLKSNFKELSKSRLKKLKELGKLKNNQTRLIKERYY